MTEGESNNSESKKVHPGRRKFNQKQYDLLKKCSDKKNMTEWNQWREENQDVDVELEGLYKANFYGWYLEKVYLHAYPNKSGNVYLRQANFQTAKLQGASFGYAHLEGAKFGCAKLQNAECSSTHFENANFASSNLKGTRFMLSHLENAVFRGVVLDGETIFWDCTISKCVSSVVRGTDFTGGQLNAVRISPCTKQLLEYNIRRMNWGDWYQKHRFLQWPVKLFWSISDYGISTKRILAWFFGLALLFAAIYGSCAYWLPPGVVSNLEVEAHLPLWHYFLLVFLRPVYFSIVTMTTLGFGDMYVNDNSVLGHVFLTVQVILGYVLLGALVTRLAVLFTSDGPAGSYTPMDKDTKKLLAKLKEDKK